MLAEGAPITAVAGHPGGHRRDGEPHVRALAAGRPGRAGAGSRPVAREARFERRSGGIL